MSVLVDGSTKRRASLGAIALGTGMLVVLAARDGAAAPDAELALVALDVAVGVAFVAAGSVARGSVVERGLVVGVGLTWLAGSAWPSLASVHQGVLAAALIGFPSARIRSPFEIALIVAAVVVAFGVVPQAGVVGLFAAVLGWTALASPRVGTAYPVASAAGVAASIALSWASHRFDLGILDPTPALVVYGIVLGIVAAAFPVAVRAVIRARARLADRIVLDTRSEGLEGVATALRAALGDPRLSVYRWDARSDSYVDDRGERVDAPAGGRGWMPIAGPDGPIAAVAHAPGGLDDPPTAAAVSSAVGLAVTNLRLQEELAERLVELEASRSRLLAAADLARVRFAEEIRDDVEPSLKAARSELSRIPETDDEAAAALDLAVGELEATSTTLSDLVMGVPPATLGDGRLREAIEDLVRRCPIPVELDLAPDASATPDAEAALYYVVAEAITNAVKHAGATRIAVRVHRGGGAISASVADDGRGGADPAGSGLQGLVDRLAVHGGRLRVESPPGAGTTLVATIPG